MLMTSLCWWQFSDIVGRIILVVLSIKKISKLTTTSTISNIRLQQRWRTKIFHIHETSATFELVYKKISVLSISNWRSNKFLSGCSKPKLTVHKGSSAGFKNNGHFWPGFFEPREIPREFGNFPQKNEYYKRKWPVNANAIILENISNEYFWYIDRPFCF